MRVAVVLAGGSSRRMGMDKLALRVKDETLLQRTCAAAARWGRVIVAGEPRPGIAAEFIVEDPPGSGPAAGIAAAFAAVQDEVDPCEVLVLAGDLANPDAVIESLVDRDIEYDGVALRDSQNYTQYLAGRYRGPALARAIAEMKDVRDVAVRRLFHSLKLDLIDAPETVTADIDTPDDALRWGARR